MIRSRTANSAALGAGLVVCFLVSSTPSRAQSAAARVQAEQLFAEARRLMAAGNTKEACPKFEESQRLDPGDGTLLNLALCHETEGRQATAWAEFKEAAGLSRRDGRPDRVAFAERHIAALEPKLARLTITLDAGAAVADLEVVRDGVRLGNASLGVPVPIDSGTHVVVARAPGHATWTSTVQIGAGETISLAVPRLAEERARRVDEARVEQAPARDTTTRSVPSADRWSTTRTVGLVAGGAGVIALGVGAYFGVRAIGKERDAHDLCQSDTACASADGFDASQDASRSALVADVAIGAGLVGIGAGVVLLVMSSKGATATQGRRYTSVGLARGRVGLGTRW